MVVSIRLLNKSDDVYIVSIPSPAHTTQHIVNALTTRPALSFYQAICYPLLALCPHFLLSTMG